MTPKAYLLGIVIYILNLRHCLGECDFPTQWQTSEGWWMGRVMNTDLVYKYSQTEVNAMLRTSVFITYSCDLFVANGDILSYVRHQIIGSSISPVKACSMETYLGSVILHNEQVLDNAVTVTNLAECELPFIDQTVFKIYPALPHDSSFSCPFGDGDYQVTLSKSFPGENLCDGDQSSTATVAGNMITFSTCQSQNDFENPFRSTLQCLSTIPATELGEPSNANGDILILYNMQAKSYYCARYRVNGDVMLSLDVHTDIMMTCLKGATYENAGNTPATNEEEYGEMFRAFVLSGVTQDPCGNHDCVQGTCLVSGTSFSCLCNSGWTGDKCDVAPAGPCENHNCVNGNCIPQGTAFSCDCYEGWEGTMCDEQANVCATNDCVNGDCTPEGVSYTCDCNPGWQGQRCDQQLDPCAQSDCVQGNCVPAGTLFSCSCFSGWFGEKCDEQVDPCANHDCVQGNCIAQGTSFACSCYSGWSGVKCDQQQNPCAQHDCVYGSCIPQVTTFICSCQSGWEGARCDIREEDPCVDNHCVHGPCVPYGSIYYCDCDNGWTGNKCDTEKATTTTQGTTTTNGGGGGTDSMGVEFALLNDYYTHVEDNPDGLEASIRTQLAEKCGASVNMLQDVSLEPGGSGTIVQCEIVPGGPGDPSTSELVSCIESSADSGDLILTDLKDRSLYVKEHSVGWWPGDRHERPCPNQPCEHGECSASLSQDGAFSHSCQCEDGYGGDYCRSDDDGDGWADNKIRIILLAISIALLLFLIVMVTYCLCEWRSPGRNTSTIRKTRPDYMYDDLDYPGGVLAPAFHTNVGRGHQIFIT